jgi:DNA-binding PadR family transcriptional regulator
MAVLAGEALHGYLIVQRLGAMPMFRRGGGKPPDATGVYRLLKAMEKEGLLASTLELAGRGPAKRRFALTVQGRASVAQWRKSLTDYAGDIAALVKAIDRPHGEGGQALWSVAGSAVAAEVPQAARRKRAKGLPRPYVVAGERLDSLDLKVLLLSQGMFVQDEVYKALGARHRISADPFECSTLFLPDKTVVHIANIGPTARFQLRMVSGRSGGAGKFAQLCYDAQPVTQIGLPTASAFYRQKTSRGLPFRGMAVLQGHDVLVFPYLWPCDYAKAGQPCRFCHLGNMTQRQWAAGRHDDAGFTPRDVAEAVHFAVNVEKSARHVQLTGGSTFNTEGECDRLVETLHAIDAVAGLAKVPGEVLVYTTPPSDPAQIDQLFAAGADRVACDIELWDEKLARQVCPGKSKWTGRQRHLNTLLHIARKYGPGKALSTFVVGLEPAESFLEGAQFLAANGIVPIPSIWMPHGLPALQSPVCADVEYFRAVRRGLAAIYQKYRCQPPGDHGFNVCLCRDTWNHRAEILAGG